MPKQCRNCDHLLQDTIKVSQPKEVTRTRKPIEHCPTCGGEVIDA